MRKVFTALLTLMLLHILGVAAYADTSVAFTQAEAGSGGDATVVDWGAAGSAVPVRDAADTPPQSVETITENGAVIVKKTYELTPGDDPQTLVRPFEQDGHSFKCREILRMELPGETLTRPAVKTALTESDSGDMAEIARQFPDSIDYEDGGYSGRLFLDASTFNTGADGYETYTYAYTKTREVPGLDRNDPSYIDREWNGMALTGMSFKQGPDGKYTALAAYRGTATGKREKGYVTTAVYRGEISMAAPGNILYTVIYEGAPIPEPPPEIMEPETEMPPGDTGEDAAPAEAAASTEPTDALAEEKRRLYAFPIFAGVVFLAGAVAVPLYVTKQFRMERKQNREAFEEIKSLILGREE